MTLALPASCWAWVICLRIIIKQTCLHFMTNASTHEYNLVSNYCALAGFIILAYDSILTLSQELSFFLKGRLTYSKILYFTLRYSLVVAWLDALLLNFGLVNPSSLKICTNLARLSEALEIVSQVTIAIVLTARTWALFGSKRQTLYVLLPMVIAICVLGFHDVAVINCKSNPSAVKTSSFKLAGFLVSCACLVFDTTVAIYTVIRYYHFRRTYGGFERVTLMDWVVKQGCLYFVSMSLANLMNIIIYWAAPVALIGIGNYAGRSISAVLTSRFILGVQSGPSGWRSTSSTPDDHVTSSEEYSSLERRA